MDLSRSSSPVREAQPEPRPEPTPPAQRASPVPTLRTSARQRERRERRAREEEHEARRLNFQEDMLEAVFEASRATRRRIGLPPVPRTLDQRGAAGLAPGATRAGATRARGL